MESKQEELKPVAINDWKIFFEVKITNLSQDDSIQILGRNWKFFDIEGQIDELDGNKVIGQTPIIPPGGSFKYSTFKILKDGAYMGTMNGRFRALKYHKDGSISNIVVPVAPVCFRYQPPVEPPNKHHAPIIDFDRMLSELTDDRPQADISDISNPNDFEETLTTPSNYKIENKFSSHPDHPSL